MPFSINGTFTIINTFVPDTTILSADMNEDLDDIADGLTELWSRTAAITFVSRIFTLSDTYVPTDGLLSGIAEGWGCGAGGGGAANAVAGQTTAGGGGGAGGYSRLVFAPGDIGASKPVTVGSGGAAGSSAGGNGGDGGDVSLGTILIAKGGSGGVGATGPNSGSGGLGGVAGTGDDAAPGQAGFPGSNGSAIFTENIFGGAGGSTLMGAGGRSFVLSSSAHQDGLPGTGFGGGGGGGASSNAGGGAVGGVGSVGYLRITELVGPT